MRVEIQFADGIIEFRDILLPAGETMPPLLVVAKDPSTPRYGNVTVRRKEDAADHYVYVEVAS